MKKSYTYQPIKFYTITFLITWIAWFIAAYLSYQENMEPLFAFLLILGLIAPFATALWLIFTSKNDELKKSFLNKLYNIKLIDISTIPAILVIMPISIVISILISLLFGYSIDQFQFSEKFSFSAGVFPVLLVLFLAASFEELGWRGYAIESLQSKYNYFIATLIFGILWAFWHFPLFFINEYYQNNLYHENIWFAANFMVSVLPIAFIIGWVYRKNNESILLAVLFHFVINISQEALQIEQFTKCIETGVLIVIACLIVTSNKKLFFESQS